MPKASFLKKKSSSLRISLILAVFFIMLCAVAVAWIIYSIFYTINNTLWNANPLVIAVILLIVCVAIGTSLSVIVSRFFLKSVHNVIAATEEVAMGNFGVYVPEEHARGDFKKLVNSFNKMTKELSSIELFRNDFINDFSHEFKTPIVSIAGFAKQLRDSSDLSESERMEYAAIIADEADRLVRMSTNILLLTKFETQEIAGTADCYDVDEQIRQTILLLEEKWTKKRIEWDISLQAGEICGNSEMFSHVWRNLLSNAVKFSTDQGIVTVKSWRLADCLYFEVIDNGIGMNAEQLPHIFERFYQCDASRKGDGNGLGLSLVKRIVDLYGGAIEVKSEMGKGSTFLVRLPIK